MVSVNRAHLAILIVNLLYGANFIIAKDIMPVYMQPFGIVTLRVAVSLVLFSLIHVFFIKEKIDKKDFPLLVLCGIFGVAINQLLFFKGLSMTTPINGAIIMTTNPIQVLIFSAIILQEKISLRKITGIAFGLAGALCIVALGKNFSIDNSTFLGDLFIFINSISWALYLVIAKPLMTRYHPITIIKWTFVFGSVFVLPIGASDFIATDFSAIPFKIWMNIAYVVIGVTFFAYLLNTIALNRLSPSVVSFYIYIQPVFTTLIAVMLGKDTITPIKVVATLLIFMGVYLISGQGKIPLAVKKRLNFFCIKL